MSTIIVCTPFQIAPDASGADPSPAATGIAPTFFDGTQVTNATAYGVPFMVANKDTLGIQLSCPSTGTPNGSIAFQVSNDASFHEGNMSPDKGISNWATLSFWDEATALWVQSKAVSAASSFMFTVPILSGRWMRAVWTNTSGSAKLTIRAQQKGDGGR